MFSNCGEFVMKISISLSIVNDVTDLICDGPKFRVSYIEQRDVVVFLKLIMQDTHYGCA